MLVLVRAYPGRVVELIKYLQIISSTEAKFKRLTWPNYEEQYRRPAAHDLFVNWGLVYLELWTRPSRSRVRLNLFAPFVTASITAKLIAPSPTLPAAPREALVLHTATISINQVDVPTAPVRSPTCAVTVAPCLNRSCDAAEASRTTLPRFSPPATAARNKLLQQSRSQ